MTNNQNKRHKGVTLERRIVYGSVAVPLEVKPPGNEDHTHTWAVYLRGHNGEDISHFVKRVTFKLHHSFEQPQRGMFDYN
jgi:YEATS domain-containing protein 4